MKIFPCVIHNFGPDLKAVVFLLHQFVWSFSPRLKRSLALKDQSKAMNTFPERSTKVSIASMDINPMRPCVNVHTRPECHPVICDLDYVWQLSVTQLWVILRVWGTSGPVRAEARPCQNFRTDTGLTSVSRGNLLDGTIRYLTRRLLLSLARFTSFRMMLNVETIRSKVKMWSFKTTMFWSVGSPTVQAQLLVKSN